VTEWLWEAYEVWDVLSKGDGALKTNTNSDKNAASRAADNNQMAKKRALSIKGLIKGTMARNSSGSSLSAVRFPAQSKRPKRSSPSLRTTTTTTATSRFGSLPLPACKPL
jgi:hypothetical protein